MSRIPSSSDVFLAVSDPTRRAILDRLLRGQAPVNELVGGFSVSRPAVSRHLRVLRTAGLVSCRRAGRSQVYSLRAGQLRLIGQWLERYRGFWEINLTHLKNHLEKKT